MASPPDTGSFAAVALPHLDAAYNLARWLMGSADDADDVVQEAMLRAMRYFSSFRGNNPRAWLLQIVRNTAFASMKRNRGMALVPLAADVGGEDDAPSAAELVEPGDDPEATLLKARDLGLVDRLLAGLPVDLRETIVLRELEELSYKDIAGITGVPIGTVMSRLWRGRRLLAAAARNEEGPSR